LKETPRSSLKHKEPEATNPSVLDYIKNNRNALFRNPIDRSDRDIPDEVEVTDNEHKTIEEILLSSKKNTYDRSLFKHKKVQKSPIYIQKEVTNPSDSRRYGNLFGTAEQRRIKFAKKRKSLPTTSFNTNGGKTTDTLLVYTNEEKLAQTKLPFQTDQIFDSQKGLLASIKIVKDTKVENDKRTKHDIRETDSAEAEEHIEVNKAPQTTTNSPIIITNESEKTLLMTSSLKESKPLKNKSLFLKLPQTKVTKSNSLFLKAPPSHYISRPLLKYPAYPDIVQRPIAYNLNYPEYVSSPGFLDYDYDYDYGPMSPAQMTEGLDLIQNVPIIDGYAKVDWIG